MAGRYAMERGWHDHELFDGDEYSRRDAWGWLIANAMWKGAKVRVRGTVVDLKRGQICFSIRFLASKWGWSKSRVDRFLHQLAAENMIEMSGTVAGQNAGHSAGQSQNIITICNYGKFQAEPKAKRDSQRDSGGEKAGQERDKEEEGKEKEYVECAHALPENWKPEPFGEGQAKAIVENWPESKLRIEVEKFRASHTAKGNKFKSWQAAWKTWVLNAKGFEPRQFGQQEFDPLDPDGKFAIWRDKGKIAANGG